MIGVEMPFLMPAALDATALSAAMALRAISRDSMQTSVRNAPLNRDRLADLTRKRIKLLLGHHAIGGQRPSCRWQVANHDLVVHAPVVAHADDFEFGHRAPDFCLACSIRSFNQYVDRTAS